MIAEKTKDFQQIEAKKHNKPSAKTQVTSQQTHELTIDNWSNSIKNFQLIGLSSELARNSLLTNINNNTITLELSENHKGIATNNAKQQLQQAIFKWCGKDLKLQLNFKVETLQNTPANFDKQQSVSRQKTIEDTLKEDTHIKDLVKVFGVKIEIVQPIQQKER